MVICSSQSTKQEEQEEFQNLPEKHGSLVIFSIYQYTFLAQAL